MLVKKPSISNIKAELKKALEFHQAGQLAAAEGLYLNLIEHDPEHSDALHLLGVIAHQRKNNDEAEYLISRAIQILPDNPYYFNNLGTVFKANGKLTEALGCYKKAIQLNSDYFEPHFKLAIVYHEQGFFEKAICCYQKAIGLRPKFAKTYYYIGLAFHDQGRLEEAIYNYQKTIELKQDFSGAYNSMGAACQSLRQFDKALSYFQKALDLIPGSDAVYVNKGNVFQDQGRYYKALSCYRNALEIRPSNAVAHLNMGISLMSLGKSEKAMSCYRRALEANPKYAKACAYFVNRLQYDCAWKEFEGFNEKLDSFTQEALNSGKMSAETPFQNITRHIDPALNMNVARLWSRSIARESNERPFYFDDRRRKTRKIRVGYLSNTFSNHPGSHLISGIFRTHDRSAFEILCFSYGADDGSYYRKRVEQDSDKFIDISRLSDSAAAELIYNYNIDILIDLRGFTRDSRLGISAMRIAPIQVVYLGYPGTTGAKFFDYIIADKIVAPKEHIDYFSEKIVYMPHCYQVNDHAQKIASRRLNRGDYGIPEGVFVFSSFVTHNKLEPIMFNCWMRILKRIPASILYLLEGSNVAQKNMRNELVKQGISDERLIFAKKLPKEEHLARLQLLDLSLDTRIYNGHTTTSDALWAGVPVLTLKGGHFASRVSASILQAIGLPELITDELREYEELAVKLADSPEMLLSLRNKLRANRLKDPLFDTLRFTKNLEKAYQKMMEIFQAGDEPRQIEVKEAE